MSTLLHAIGGALHDARVQAGLPMHWRITQATRSEILRLQEKNGRWISEAPYQDATPPRLFGLPVRIIEGAAMSYGLAEGDYRPTASPLAEAVARIEAAILESCNGAGSIDFAHARVPVADLRLVLTALERGNQGKAG